MDNLNSIITVNNFTKNRIYHIHNDKGLGDNVFNMILISIIKDFIVNNNIKIFYYTKDIYIKELYKFISIHENVFLVPLNVKPYFSIEIWIDNKFLNYTLCDNLSKSPISKVDYNKYYKHFFNIVLKKLNFNITINKLVYYDEDLLNRYELLPNKFKNFDILILNSQPMSGQYNYDKNCWDDYIIKLNSTFKIMTTTKVEGVLCSYDDNLSLKDIASLSTKAKVVIAINSGVLPGLLNYYTLTNVRHFYIFDNRCFYSYPNFENRNNITDITFEELHQYLDSDNNNFGIDNNNFGIDINSVVEQ
jgi:hypothetical protein